MFSIPAVSRSALALIMTLACVALFVPVLLVVVAMYVTLAIVAKLIVSNPTVFRKVSAMQHARVRESSSVAQDRSVIDTTWERVE